MDFREFSKAYNDNVLSHAGLTAGGGSINESQQNIQQYKAKVNQMTRQVEMAYESLNRAETIYREIKGNESYRKMYGNGLFPGVKEVNDKFKTAAQRLKTAMSLVFKG